MEPLQRAAVLAELADRMWANGNWCGETHIQKATYLLNRLLGVPLGVLYILYKHGPYSFDLSEVLTAMRADLLLEKVIVSQGYGPRLRPTVSSQELRARHSSTLQRYRPQIEFVVQTIGTKGVAELEKLATALYVTSTSIEATPETRANTLHQFKPHIPPSDALAAIRDLDRIAVEARQVSFTSNSDAINSFRERLAVAGQDFGDSVHDIREDRDR